MAGVTVVNQVATLYTLQTAQYTAQASQVVSSTLKMGGAIDSTSDKVNKFLSGSGFHMGMMQGIRLIERMTEAILGLEVAFAGVGLKMMHEAAHFENLVHALQAVEGSAEMTKRALDDLKQIGKLPGVGFEAGIEAFTGLRRGGVGENLSRKVIVEFANQNIAGGGDKASFERVVTALQEIAASDKVSGRQLLMLLRDKIPLGPIMRQAFGTAEPQELEKLGIGPVQFLQGLVNVMEKMPRVAGGTQNAIDNLGDAFQRLEVAGGQIINSGLFDSITNLGDAFDRFADSSVFAGSIETITNDLLTLVQSFGDGSLDGALQQLALDAEDAAGAMRNFDLNLVGFIEHIKMGVEAWWNTSPAGIAKNLWDRLTGNSDPTDYSTSGEAKRNARTVEMEAELDAMRRKNQREGKKWVDAKGVVHDPSKEGANAPKLPDDVLAQQGKEQIQYLSDIARHTRQTHEDIKQYVLGGGEMAKLGVTPVELNGFRRSGLSSLSRLRHRYIDLEKGMMDMAMDMAQEMIEQMQRGRPAHAR